jgi:hypothetical protein
VETRYGIEPYTFSLPCMTVWSDGVPLSRVTARQADGLVWLRLPRVGGVVTWFVTGSGTDNSASLDGSICTHRAWSIRCEQTQQFSLLRPDLQK